MAKKKGWTKKELSLRSGMKELAAAVIEQWVADKKPADPGIEPWIAIYKELSALEVMKGEGTLCKGENNG